MTRVFYILGFVFFFCSLIWVPESQAGGKQQKLPNIVFILADDLGWTDLGVQGSRYYETPHIDKLARQGMTFTNAYTSAPNCAPTRACLMSGRSSPRHGVYTVGSGARGLPKFRRMVPAPNNTKLPLNEVTVADSMQKAGYRTGLFGKWHLGNKGKYFPSKRGFDEAIVATGRHFNFNVIPKTPVEKGEYLADFNTRNALRFIEKNKDRPFFLFLSHFAVHTPLQAKQRWIDHFRDKKAVGGHRNPVYAAMIASLDESVGRVMAKLDELGLDENTVVIFSSDNGGVGGYALAGVLGALEITVNSPLRGGKGMLYEGGVRVPFIVRWPGTIPPKSKCDEPITSVDLFPTFVELANGKTGEQELDGESLVSLLKSSGKAKLKRKALYWHFPGYLQASSGGAKKGSWRTTPVGSIRVGDFKLLEFFEDDRVELYNLNEDLSQKNDLVKKNPAKAKELHDMLRAWRKRVNAPMPTPKKGASALRPETRDIRWQPRDLRFALVKF